MKLFLCIWILAFAGCAREDSWKPTKLPPIVTEKVSGNQLDIDYGQTVHHEGYNLEISFDSLSESRCPPNVVCVWEGDAVTSLNVRNLSDQSTGTVKPAIFGNLASRSVRWNTYVFEIVELNYPDDIQHYTVRILISETQ